MLSVDSESDHADREKRSEWHLLCHSLSFFYRENATVVLEPQVQSRSAIH